MPIPYVNMKKVEEILELVDKKELSIAEAARAKGMSYKQAFRYYTFGHGSTKYIKRARSKDIKNGKLSTQVKKKLLTKSGK